LLVFEEPKLQLENIPHFEVGASEASAVAASSF